MAFAACAGLSEAKTLLPALYAAGVAQRVNAYLRAKLITDPLAVVAQVTEGSLAAFQVFVVDAVHLNNDFLQLWQIFFDSHLICYYLCFSILITNCSTYSHL